jgi:acyl carrier protein
MNIDYKVLEIMKNIFGIELPDNLNDVNMDLVENWDSINHLNLIVSLEEEFSVVLNEKEIEDAKSYYSICSIISKKL